MLWEKSVVRGRNVAAEWRAALKGFFRSYTGKGKLKHAVRKMTGPRALALNTMGETVALARFAKRVRRKTGLHGAAAWRAIRSAQASHNNRLRVRGVVNFVESLRKAWTTRKKKYGPAGRKTSVARG